MTQARFDRVMKLALAVAYLGRIAALLLLGTTAAVFFFDNRITQDSLIAVAINVVGDMGLLVLSVGMVNFIRRGLQPAEK